MPASDSRAAQREKACRYSSRRSSLLKAKRRNNVDETDALVERSLIQLDDELKAIDPALKAEWDRAEAECPHLVDRKHKLLFLRYEMFDAELAALRIVNYWSKRVELFGEDAFEPLSIERSMKNDMAALSMGTFVWTEMYDAQGRGIFIEYFDNFDAHFEHKSHSYVRNRSIPRVWWYMIHAALQDERVQKNGARYIMVARPFHPWRNFHMQQAEVILDLMAFALPIRFVETHVGRPSLLFRFMNLSVFRRMLAARQRLEPRNFVHLGSPEKVCQRLTENHQLPREAIPKELGGDLTWDHQAWIRQRQEKGL